MRYINDGPYRHPVCDFCDTDKTANNVAWIRPVGEKGICNNCAADLAQVLLNVDAKQGRAA